MNDALPDDFFFPARWLHTGRGPRYRQLSRMISDAITTGELAPDTQLPPERDMATLTGLSRVTIRKAISELVKAGLVDQLRGAGSFVRPPATKLDQSLSSLESFTEALKARGKTSSSALLRQGLFTPTANERVIFGLATGDKVARIDRLRSADGVPMAVEYSSLPADILPNPEQVTTSLYDVLRLTSSAPVRAIQRINAVNLTADEARLLEIEKGIAVLLIERTSFLPSGRPVEFTRGLYRSDLYDFVSELRLDTNR